MAPQPARQQAQQQPHGGAGVAAVEQVGGLPEAIEPHPLHEHLFAGADRRHPHPHGPQAGGGAERILRRQQPLDACGALGDGAEK